MAINVPQRIIDGLNNNQREMERAIVVLDDKGLFHETHARRAKFFASWLRKGNTLSPQYVNEAKALVLQYVPSLIRLSIEKTAKNIEKTQKEIQALEECLVRLREWNVAVRDELNKLPFGEAPKTTGKTETLKILKIAGKTISQICYEEGLY